MAPTRTHDQRLEALVEANRIRCARAMLKRHLAAGTADLAAVISDPAPEFANMKVIEALLATPKIGNVKAGRILNQLRVSRQKTIGGLSDRQRAEFVSRLRGPGILS